MTSGWAPAQLSEPKLRGCDAAAVSIGGIADRELEEGRGCAVWSDAWVLTRADWPVGCRPDQQPRAAVSRTIPQAEPVTSGGGGHEPLSRADEYTAARLRCGRRAAV